MVTHPTASQEPQAAAPPAPEETASRNTEGSTSEDRTAETTAANAADKLSSAEANKDTAPPAAPPAVASPTGREQAVARALQRATPRPANALPRVATVAAAAAFGAMMSPLIANGIAGMNGSDPDPVAALSASVGSLALELREQAATIDRIAANLAPQQISSEITGAIPIPTPPPRPDIAKGWQLRHAQEGRAVVYGRGAFHEVFPGSKVPGLGFVLKIARDRMGWFVSTENGAIVSIGG